MSMLPPMSARLQMTIIWIDETHIRLLVNDRDAWHGTSEVISLLKQLEELDYVVLSEYDDMAAYHNRHTP